MMRRVRLGEIELSRIVYGMWRLGDDADTSARHIQAKIEACLAQGITTIDQADIYGGYTAEALLGTALKAAPALRDRIEIVTKCGIVAPAGRYADRRLKYYDTSAGHIAAWAERSPDVPFRQSRAAVHQGSESGLTGSPFSPLSGRFAATSPPLRKSFAGARKRAAGPLGAFPRPRRGRGGLRSKTERGTSLFVNLSGDHLIVVASVTAATLRDGEPLLFFGGFYGRLQDGSNPSAAMS